MSDSNSPSHPENIPPANAPDKSDPSDPSKTEGKAKEGETASTATPVPAKAPAKGKGLIAFVGRLRRSSRKSRAAAEAREAAAAAARKEARALRSASLRSPSEPAVNAAASSPENKGEGSFARSQADEVVKPIRPEDLKDSVAGVDAKVISSDPAVPGGITIEKVERRGTRSERGKTPDKPVVIRDEKQDQRRKNIVTGFKIGLAVLFFAVAGVLVFLSLRETRVKIAVNTSSSFEVDPEVLIVVDFQERIDLLKRDLLRREDPLRKMIASIDQDLSAAKADYAGRAAKRKLLVDALNKDKAEIPVILEGTQKNLEKLWREDADNLDAEYEHKKDAFNKEIGARAKQLNLTQYTPSDELDAPEIAVNAFRLALYSAPEGVDTGKERGWAEDRLKGWRKYEDGWSERQLKIKQEADALRQTIQPEIDDVKGRVAVRQEEIAAVDLEIEEFGKEVARHEEKKKEQQDELAAVGNPFYQDLLKAPNEYVITRWTLEKLGLADIRNLDRDPNFPPGDYRILVRAKKKGVDYWAQKTFLVTKYKTTKVTLEDSDFFPVKSLLEEK